jgi:hypothetical protein
MEIKDQIIVGCLIGILIFLGALLYKPIYSEKKLKEIREYEYNRGYTDYQIDKYVPSSLLPEGIQIKKRNPKLKEKFKG